MANHLLLNISCKQAILYWSYIKILDEIMIINKYLYTYTYWSKVNSQHNTQVKVNITELVRDFHWNTVYYLANQYSTHLKHVNVRWYSQEKSTHFFMELNDSASNLGCEERTFGNILILHQERKKLKYFVNFKTLR